MSPTTAPSRVPARLVLIAVALVLLVAAALGIGAASAPDAVRSAATDGDSTRSERPAPRDVPVGVSPGFGIIDLPAARQRADLLAIRRLGADRVRLDLSWARIEARPGRFDWTDTDRLLAAARASDLRVLAVVGFRPSWSRLGQPDPVGFGRFVAAAARRYGSLVSAWEIWNEPNLRRAWSTRPSPAAYARIATTAARAVRTHDAGAPVVLGALAPAVDTRSGDEVSPLTFLRGVYRAGLDRSLFDAVSVHPYSYPALPSDQQDWNTFHRLPDLHGVMQDAGDGAKTLWLTEYGAPTGQSSRAVSRSRHARMLVDAYRRAMALPFVGALFVYSLRDTAADTTDPEAGFGLLDHRGRAKPAYRALQRELAD